MMQPPALANLTERATVLSPDRGRVVTFDRDGRLVSYFRRGETLGSGIGQQVEICYCGYPWIDGI